MPNKNNRKTQQEQTISLVFCFISAFTATRQ